MPPGLRTRPPSSSTSREQNETPNKKQKLTQEEEEQQQQTQPPFTDTLAVGNEDGRVESPLTVSKKTGYTDLIIKEVANRKDINGTVYRISVKLTYSQKKKIPRLQIVK